MRRARQIIFLFVMMALTNMFLSIPVYGYDKSKIPEYIRIGLKYGESATPLVSVYSKNGLELGYFAGNEFRSIFSFLGNDEIIVRKDSYFMAFNGSFLEYQYDEQRDMYNTNLQGPIHIQIGSTFQTREEAQNFLNTLPRLHTTPYLSYENGWKVWTGLFTSMANAQGAAENIRLSLPEMEISFVPQHDKRIQILSKSGEVLCMLNLGEMEYHFRPIPQKDGGNLIRLDGKNFRGSIIIRRYSGSDFTVINRLPLEEYLYGVVPKEMSGTWPLEAQKAQAVAARNYTVQKLGAHSQYGFDLCATTHCQVYGGYDGEHERSRKAVDETKGKILTYKGNIVTAFYHSNSGGHTENSENVWTSPIDYLKGVNDPYSVGSPNDTWSYTLTKEQIQDILNSKQLSVGEVNGIKATEYSPFGRVLKLEIQGTQDKKILEKEKIRSIFGYNNIKSTWFTIRTDAAATVISGSTFTPQQINVENIYVITTEGIKQMDNGQPNIFVYNGSELKNVSFRATKYVFDGKGWGHGLGMSQWGAKKMAEDGYTYDQILTYYYSGTKIE
ncbi:SpoIID/LytB domain-containing protein [Thermotalea metallivorans]|uniref:Amidase enhancer n=1 Tax=Thermotalea metallivorans TaxID=520762 RepID=A0A140L8Z1_9FIRM|nr:SpoIID/LytB domain-containing protein [Thermotalea metallivorans]KXG77016.1 Amidase enhancer [Thermotalea metallivorans]